MIACSGATAIVADDHELFRAGLAAILRRDLHFGRVIEVESLPDAVVALDAASDTTFISLDLAMPGMKGAETVQALRHAYPALRIAVITASDKRDDILLLLQGGVHGFIPKTLGISEIRTALRQILAGQIYVPAALSSTVSEAPSSRFVTSMVQKEVPKKGSRLSPRQMEVLALMAKGRTNKEIARDLGLAEGTIKVHVNALFRSLGAHNRVTAVASLMQMSEPTAS